MHRYAKLSAVLTVQVVILLVIPARQILAKFTGESITLATAPVDPFDTLSGHYVTLSYEVERDCPIDDPRLKLGEEVWLTVQRSDTIWTCVSVTRERPAPASGIVSLRTRLRYWWNPNRADETRSASIEGAKRFYIPESRRDEIEKAFQAVKHRALVDLRVGRDGSVALVSVRAGSLLLDD